ncbi:transglutaminase domain-containing protein [Streptomyces sp. NPDC000987]|uniref:transglutaminase domain-containing protein n=1 Tax=Streptomyces sp. NPDC000987 TaxID=3154374 RepID=UPI003324E3BE
MTSHTSAGADTWLGALDRLRRVPGPYFRATLDVTEAAKQLGASAETVHALIDAGLPAEEGSGGPRLDYHDVANLGLAAGLGRSLGELAEGRMLRMAAGEPEGWVKERTWRLRLTAPCDADGCPGERPTAPEPELLDGTLLDFADAGDHIVATVVTRGLPDAPRTAAVRAVYDDLLAELDDGTYQFGWLPHRLRALPATAAAHGMVDCRVAAWIMERRAREAGLAARVRVGFVLGLVGVEHAWTEVLEGDRWLPLDPVLAFLARRHRTSNPAFTDFCRGSVHNRLLAWPAAADRPLVAHDCAHGGRVTLACNQLMGR